MRHDRGPDDAKRQIKHLRIAYDIYRWRKTLNHPAPVRISHGNLEEEANEDHPQQRDDKRLHPAKAEPLQPENDEHIQRRDDHADFKRNAKQ